MPDLPDLPEDAPGNTTDSAAPATPGARVRDRTAPETDAERRRRRAQFLRDLAEARELRARVQPRRAKAARLRHAMRMRTFRW
ncbi:hypothetical protein ACFV2Z_05670 [Streptomyces sp. NPDC059688]|uniref:DUF4461 domain-containing protein n=1 Tax=Streptomyces albidocamelliae TaxID=2981135 RepID=A0ABY6EQH6_9ACTN|nr:MULTISPECIES: hypothetical protein [unclassified Streptomyces]OKJ85833.1 hypothetical protein AMK32_00370 [Streptomyces sp. CB01883]ROP52323.1 hypothetical protein EDD94_1773 [Streptomyces sp. PanSC9]UXY36648.1 DUF4461 domain-containing protein [Streptomyces sp. HUAS 14-6]